LAALLLFNAKLFVLLFIILLPALFILYAITKRRLSAIRKHVKNAGEDTLQHLQEGISGFAESNIYNRNDFFTHRYAKSQERLNSYLAELQTTQAIPSRLIEVFALFGLLLLISVTKFLALGSYGPGLVTVGAFIAAAYKIIPGMVRISNISGQIKTYDYTLDDLIALKQAKSSKKTSAFMERIRSIEFNNTGFDRGTHPVLCSFYLHIRSGDFVGVSGISGIGKTTLINLLMGFLEPGRGNILINNKETQVSDRYNYQQRIAYVKQQPFLLHDSILNNITIGEENPDRKKILEIAGISGIGNWINIISGDYSKMVSENGKNISGGQRQRIAIARALYKDADVLILDEPFNELDKASVFPVLSHLMKLSKSGKIIILITHDRQNLAFCNKIVTINGSGYCETK
jgi:ABC-type bacteriocin/lantibiotic exporter with double-glycine peptidase domain